MGFIGVIDSGVGGLTVLQKLQRAYPYNYCYVADHAFCPYGAKSNEVLFARADKLVAYLATLGAQAVVLACNTISVYADRLASRHNLPVCGVIVPTCNAVIEHPDVKRVALLATKSTISNRAYHNALSQHGVDVNAFDCSAFVPFVEQCATTSLACLDTVDKALRTLPKTHADAVILGCTHFPLLRRQIAYYCDDSKIVECRCDLSNVPFTPVTKPYARYFTTGNVEFANTAARWYDHASFVHLNL